MTEIKLKPCPFCKGRAKIEENNSYTPFSEELTYVYVRCSKCGCEPFMSKRVVNVRYQENHEEILNNLKHGIAEEWNRREDNKTEIIDEKMRQEINRIMNNGDRVELIKVKDGVKVIQVRRKEIKLKD